MQRDAKSCNGGIAQELTLVAFYAAGDAHGNFLVSIDHAPNILAALAADEEQALVRSEVGGGFGGAVAPEIVGRCAENTSIAGELACDQGRVVEGPMRIAMSMPALTRSTLTSLSAFSAPLHQGIRHVIPKGDPIGSS
jgi:hypothetical protein